MAHRAVVTALCITALAGIASASPILNPSFETPTTGSFVYDPTGSSWTFTGGAGVASNTFFVPPPPDGTQAAFVQNGGGFSQSLSGLSLTPMTLSFYIAERPGYPANPIVVTYGAQTLGTFTPTSTNFTLVSIPFTPATASGTLQFGSAGGTGDIDSALDLVTLNSSVTSVPEPSTLLLMVPAIAGLSLLRRRRTA
jgi:hypothetical protein